jgi:hypothetical protein
VRLDVANQALRTVDPVKVVWPGELWHKWKASFRESSFPTTLFIEYNNTPALDGRRHNFVQVLPTRRNISAAIRLQYDTFHGWRQEGANLISEVILKFPAVPFQ